MPELPEVESIRRSLLPHLVGRAVVSAHLLRRDILIAPGDPAGGFPRQRRTGSRPPRARPVTPADLLAGSTITDIRRWGKQLAILGGGGRSLVVQLGMTGHLSLTGAPASAKHTHARWSLDSGEGFVFDDPRRFGAIRVFRAPAQLEAHWAVLGPDALAIAAAELSDALRGSKRPIKAALLDQAVLAGVGNIYADEALFESRIRPHRLADSLNPSEIERLAAAIRAVLKRSLEAGGSTVRDYADANGRSGDYQRSHAVYGRAGLPCVECATPLRACLLAQRMTVWCPACQPPRPAKRPRKLSTGRPDRETPRVSQARPVVAAALTSSLLRDTSR